MVVNKKKLDIVMANVCITSGDLQKKSELPRGTFLNVITGKNVRPATVGKIAKALNVPVESLINMDEGN
jgi:predicted transcriptional regulator